MVKSSLAIVALLCGLVNYDGLAQGEESLAIVGLRY